MRSSEASAGRERVPAFITPNGNQSLKGFTLIELLVVIAIISLLSSVVLASLQDARAKGGNAARVSDINQYVLASELYFDAAGGYPKPSVSDNSWTCLGDYSDDRCWGSGGTATAENAALNTAFVEFLPQLPVQKGLINNTEGYLYACRETINGKCTRYEIRWYLQKAGQSCGRGKTGSLAQPAGITYCQLCHPDKDFGTCAS